MGFAPERESLDRGIGRWPKRLSRVIVWVTASLTGLVEAQVGLILALFRPLGAQPPSRNRATRPKLAHRHTPCWVGCPNRLKSSNPSQPNCSNSAR